MNRYVFLVGFMAAGKTTAGQLAAQRLGLPFVDLDTVIEQQAGTTVSGLFDSAGEAEFRRLEAQALRRVIAGQPAVVATGGGAPSSGDNMDQMRRAGLVVALSAPIPELVGRVADPSTRPLLALPPEQLQALYASREPAYRRAHAVVRTDDASPDTVADAIAQLARMCGHLQDVDLPSSLIVELADRAYPIVIQGGSLARLGEMIARVTPDLSERVAVVSDDNVSLLYGDAARESLERAGYAVSTQVVPAGEASKSLDTVAGLAERLVASGLDRKSAIIALGGGVVGDLTGFVAASLFRGIRCVQVPTTLVAMTDSAIGGKTGVNLSAGKNLVGAFWQPSLVIADTETLSTLPERERRAAFGELIKYGLLDGEDLLGRVEALAGQIPPEHVILRCAGIKSWIVVLDEREQTGERALLNLGHTVGHAIEAAAGYGAVHHGEAVALGLIASCRVSARLGLCDAALEGRVTDAVTGSGLSADLDRWLTDDVMRRLGVDKKRTRRSIGFVALAGVGRPLLRDLEISELERILRA